jgi:hypothetical protein
VEVSQNGDVVGTILEGDTLVSVGTHNLQWLVRAIVEGRNQERRLSEAIALRKLVFAEFHLLAMIERLVAFS